VVSESANRIKYNMRKLEAILGDTGQEFDSGNSQTAYEFSDSLREELVLKVWNHKRIAFIKRFIKNCEFTTEEFCYAILSAMEKSGYVLPTKWAVESVLENRVEVIGFWQTHYGKSLLMGAYNRPFPLDQEDGYYPIKNFDSYEACCAHNMEKIFIDWDSYLMHVLTVMENKQLCTYEELEKVAEAIANRQATL